MSVPDEKAAMRAELRARARAIKPGERSRLSDAIAAHIGGSAWWARAGMEKQAVLLFAGDATEPDLDALIGVGVDAGKTVCVPTIDWEARALFPARVRSTSDLVAGRHGIRVPGAGCGRVDASEIALALVPGVGFDRCGGRLGRGGGFYDRFLAAWRGVRPMGCIALGVGFDASVVDRLPGESHDARLDGLATESGLRVFGEEEAG